MYVLTVRGVTNGKLLSRLNSDLRGTWRKGATEARETERGFSKIESLVCGLFCFYKKCSLFVTVSKEVTVWMLNSLENY